MEFYLIRNKTVKMRKTKEESCTNSVYFKFACVIIWIMQSAVSIRTRKHSKFNTLISNELRKHVIEQAAISVRKNLTARIFKINTDPTRITVTGKLQ